MNSNIIVADFKRHINAFGETSKNDEKWLRNLLQDTFLSRLLVLFGEVCTILLRGRKDYVITLSSGTIAFKMSTR